ncbi:MAG: hypothetical protein ACYTKD_08260 [Planctomycetota bacterium]|jgi:hypothetical protein
MNAVNTMGRRWRTAVVAVSAALFLGGGCLYNTAYARPRGESHGRYWSSRDAGGCCCCRGSSCSSSRTSDRRPPRRRDRSGAVALGCVLGLALLYGLSKAASSSSDSGGSGGDNYTGIGCYY